MRKTLPLAIGLAALVVLAYAPAATATHNQLRIGKDYVAGLDTAVICDPLGVGFSIGGACFDLNGRENRVAFYVDDLGHHELGKVEYKTDRHVANAFRAYRDAGGPDPAVQGQPATRAVEDLYRETLQLSWIAGVWQYLDASGSVLRSGVFCQAESNLFVPTGASQLQVVLDGPVTGFAQAPDPGDDPTEPAVPGDVGPTTVADLVANKCGSNYTGATQGTVFFHVPVQHA